MLHETVDNCNKTYHRPIKMKPADLKLGTHIEYAAENNGKYSKFKDHVRTSK